MKTCTLKSALYSCDFVINCLVIFENPIMYNVLNCVIKYLKLHVFNIGKAWRHRTKNPM